MDLLPLIKSYLSLSPRDQGAFAAVVICHQEFGGSSWREEISRRHREIEAGRAVCATEVAEYVQRLGTRGS